MSTGKAHATASVLAAPAMGLTLIFLVTPEIGVGAFLGCLLGVVLTPDLDQITISKSEWWIVRYVPVVGWLWMALWDLYARLIPHRSFWSHAPIVGTAGRLLYLGTIASLRWSVLPMLSIVWVQGAILGLAASDTIHCLMDLGGKK